jgi:acetyl-CoA acetyltransferase
VQKAGHDPKDIDLHEINEAFAASSLTVAGAELDPAKINVMAEPSPSATPSALPAAGCSPP